MILIRFRDTAAKRRAMETLVGEFSFKSWSSGEMLVPEEALSYLGAEGIDFTVEREANWARLTCLVVQGSTAVKVAL